MKKCRLFLQSENLQIPQISPIYEAEQESQQVVSGQIVRAVKSVVVDNRQAFKSLQSSDYSLNNLIAAGVPIRPATMQTPNDIETMSEYEQNMNAVLDKMDTAVTMFQLKQQQQEQQSQPQESQN